MLSSIHTMFVDERFNAATDVDGLLRVSTMMQCPGAGSQDSPVTCR
jgi:hypothetical protein